MDPRDDLRGSRSTSSSTKRRTSARGSGELLRAAVIPGPNDLFPVGDTHQRIYDHRVSLKQIGIDIAGRSERLKINYRTTAEILGWSLGLLRGERIDDMNEDLETLAGCRSDVHSGLPILHGASSRLAEMEHRR